MEPEPITQQPAKKDLIGKIGDKFMELTHAETAQEARLWLSFIAVSFLLVSSIIVGFQNEEKAKFYQAHYEQVTICQYLNYHAQSVPKAEYASLMQKYCAGNYTKTLEESFKFIKVVR